MASKQHLLRFRRMQMPPPPGQWMDEVLVEVGRGMTPRSQNFLSLSVCHYFFDVLVTCHAFIAGVFYQNLFSEQHGDLIFIFSHLLQELGLLSLPNSFKTVKTKPSVGSLQDFGRTAPASVPLGSQSRLVIHYSSIIPKLFNKPPLSSKKKYSQRTFWIQTKVFYSPDSWKL